MINSRTGKVVALSVGTIAQQRQRLRQCLCVVQ
jgi:hypothetical protein